MSLLATSSSSFVAAAGASVVAAASASFPRRHICAAPLSAVSSSARRLFSTTATAQAKPRRTKGKNPFDTAPWEPFLSDDIPTLGHELLQRQRDLLHYARIVAHELPNLEKLRQAYKPPSASSSILRFRSVHRQGEPHPANRKSVVTIDVKQLYEHEVFQSIADESTRVRTLRKLLHLAGPRWDPGAGPLAEPLRLDGNYGDHVTVRGVIKISSERFPSERQNMKWCSDVVDEMIREAQNLDDGVADCPIDLRHAVIRERKKAHGLSRRKATIADWPSEWATPNDKESEMQQ